MKHQLVWLICTLLLVVSSKALSKREYIQMHMGDVRVINLADIEEIAVGDEKYVNYAISDANTFMLFGKEPGVTEVHVWQKGRRHSLYRVRVLTPDVSDDLRFARSLASNIQGLEVRKENNHLIFSGNISASRAEVVEAIVVRFDNAINLVEINEFDTRQVVRIDVTLLEVKQNALENVGIDWDDAIAGPVVGAHKTFSRNDFFRVFRNGPNDGNDAIEGILQVVPNDYSFYGYSGLTTFIGSVINLLVEKGDAHVIASPKLLAKSGELASFLSGGEFPLPVRDDEGQLVVQFREYGVRLDIEPNVNSEGVIETFIFTELSSIDFANTVLGVPGVLSRNSETTVNLRDGETIAISGLVLAEVADSESKVPLLGDIPILGNLFKTKNSTGSSTELVIMLTPRIVTPSSSANQKLLNAAQPIRDRFSSYNWETSLME